MSISVDVAVHNLEVLKTFAVGELPVYNKDTGEISKEDRVYLVAVRRWWTSAFNPHIVLTTFAETLPYLKVTEIKMYDNNDPESVKKNREVTDAITKDFPLALDGVKNMIQTYNNTQKVETAKKIQEVYDKFIKEYEETLSCSSFLCPFPPTPPPIHRLPEKKNNSTSTVAAVNAAAKARSAGVFAQYQQDLHAQIYSELQRRVAMQLKKVESISPPKVEQASFPFFNTAMLDKLPHAPVLDLETDEKEWEIDKPALLRTQSVRIERHLTPVRNFSRPVLIPKKTLKPFSMDELKSRMADFSEKIKERRKVFGKDPK